MTNDLQTLEPRVRAALREAANQVHVASDGWEAIHLPVRHRPALRVAVVVVALVASSVVAVGLLLHDEPATVDVTAGRPRELEPEALKQRDADLNVWMQVRARDEDISAVRSVIESLADVEWFAFLDKQAAFVEFQRVFADQPELVKNIDASSLPTSFRLVVKPNASKRLIALELGALLSVDEVQIKGRDHAPPSMTALDDGAELEVFMQVHAPNEQVEPVREFLDEGADIDEVVFVDKEDALERFRDAFRGDPDLVRGITSEALPVSFRVFLEPDASKRQVRRDIEALSGVDVVIVVKNR